jgi:hypothetical protein
MVNTLFSLEATYSFLPKEKEDIFVSESLFLGCYLGEKLVLPLSSVSGSFVDPFVDHP